ncbi:MAG: M23 family metallopeptidase [Roseitalea sp.]|jgi:murein DD-endopeptidase MepM/ murein hydrolase activator NlpD|nr:M23 family metallopeptidase [Roseitalea sp.]MBO6723781.1 M23 family metallopeptidase [Roseitalea sp.]MBO6741931.1 M23 family metallopeptidase [Roseitalea sp.]
MNRIHRIACAGFLISALFVLSACTGNGYGRSAIYSQLVEDEIRVVMPANAPSISQQFRVAGNRGGRGSPTSFHEGIDIIARVGTPVIAAAPGRVVDSFMEPMYGNRVVIDHGIDATGRRARTVYMHLDSRRVRSGTQVARGQEIGTMGRTGVLAAAISHLHFEVHRQRGSRGVAAQDPHLFWADGVGRVTCFDPQRAADDGTFRITYPVPCRDTAAR